MMTKTKQELRTIGVSELRRGRYQPRNSFDQAALEELADSIRESGILEPIVVYPSGDGYEILAGERRWRAAQIAGIHEVPCVVREELSDEQILVLSIIENLQREDLNPVEQARAMSQLQREFGLSVAEVGRRLGIPRSTASNALRLLTLDNEILGYIESGKLSEGHGKSLLAASPERRTELARVCVQRQLSIKALDTQIKGAGKGEGKPTKNQANEESMRYITRLEDRVSRVVGQTTEILASNENGSKGRISLTYNSFEEMEGILEKLGVRLDEDA